MFKFFRDYNKIILVVGGCVLMVAFLVPQAVQMFGPERMRANRSVGTAHGEDVTQAQLESAASELRFLSGLPLGGALITDDPLAWTLIQADARDMGLYASDREVELALQAVGLDATQTADLARQNKTTVDTIQHAVRRLLISEQYRQLVAGTAYRDPRGASPSLAIEKLQVQTDLVQRELARIPEQLHPMIIEQLVPYARVVAAGTHRLSAPLLEHFVQDNYTNASGRVAMIQPDTASVDQPSDDRLQEVFEQYRDVLAGQGEPFPFGYRYPDRVKLQTLRLPIEEVRNAVEVDFVDVLDAYRNQPRRFADAEGNTPAMPSPEDARELTDELRRQRAEQLAGRILAQIQSRFVENRRGFPEDNGYVELPEDFEPASWQPIIDRVRTEHGVSLQIEEQGDDWIPISRAVGPAGHRPVADRRGPGRRAVCPVRRRQP